MASARPSRLRGWAIRAVVLFLAVYALGLFRVPTLIPYLAVLLVVLADLIRAVAAGRPGLRHRPPQETPSADRAVTHRGPSQ